MESNISRDHIALEAMKVILEKGIEREQTLWNKIKVLLGGEIRRNIRFPYEHSLAKQAYKYADAMIAEREKDNGGRQEEA